MKRIFITLQSNALAHTRTHRHIRQSEEVQTGAHIIILLCLNSCAGLFLYIQSASLFLFIFLFFLFHFVSLTRFLLAFCMDAFMQNGNLISKISSIFISITSFVFVLLLLFMYKYGRIILYLLNVNIEIIYGSFIWNEISPVAYRSKQRVKMQ